MTAYAAGLRAADVDGAPSLLDLLEIPEPGRTA